MVGAELRYRPRVRTAGWSSASKAAAAMLPAGAWRRGLAESVERATGCPAAVFTCQRGQPWTARFDSTSEPLEDIGRVMVGRFIPLVEARRKDTAWRKAIATHGHVFPSIEAVDVPARFLEQVRRQVFAPHGVEGALTAMLPDASGEIMGWIAIVSDRSSTSLLRAFGRGMSEVGGVASERIEAALDLARECGAVFPAPPAAGVQQLSKRERQIAELAAQGFSDLNIAMQLDVCEATVGSHLYRIYKRLGIHSRVELAQKLGGLGSSNER